MVSFEELPRGWFEHYETGPRRGSGPYTEELDAVWYRDEDQLWIEAEHHVDQNGNVSYIMTVYQKIEANGLATEIETNRRIAKDRRDLEEQAVEFMREIDCGQHTVHAFSAEVPDENPFVQFYTVSDSQIMGSDTADESVVDTITDESSTMIESVSNDVVDSVPDEQKVRIDVIPRHRSRVNSEE